MRPSIVRILFPLGIAVALSLLAFLPAPPESDPAWWLLGGLEKAQASPADILVLDADRQTRLGPAALAVDLRELAEFDAASVVVDLPVDWSEGSLTSTATLARIRSGIDEEFCRIDSNFDSFWQGLRSGSLRAADAVSGYAALQELLGAARGRLLDDATPDSAQLPSLEAAMALAPPTWYGLGLLPLPGAPREDENAWLAKDALRDVASVGVPRQLPEIAGLDFLPPEVEALAAGSGFSLRDESASRDSAPFPMRRFSPLANYEGSVVAHPALLVLERRMGAQRLEIEAGGIRLVGAKVYRGGVRDVLIPLDGEGKASEGRPDASGTWPRRLPLSTLDDYRRTELRVVEAVGALEKGGLLVTAAPPSALWKRATALGDGLLAETPHPATDGGTGGTGGTGGGKPAATSDSSQLPPLLAPPAPSQPGPQAPVAAAVSAAAQVATPTPAERLAAWRDAKLAFFEAAGAALDERRRMDELLAGLLSTPGLGEKERDGVLALRDRADRAFGEASAAIDDWKASRAGLMAELGGSLVLVGPEPYRSRGGFVPPKGAAPVDPSGDTAAFLRAGLSDAFLRVAGASEVFPVALAAGILFSLLLLVAGPKPVLASGIFAALALAVFAGLALRESGAWWSPTLPALAAVVPGLAALAAELLNAWIGGRKAS